MNYIANEVEISSEGKIKQYVFFIFPSTIQNRRHNGLITVKIFWLCRRNKIGGKKE